VRCTYCGGKLRRIHRTFLQRFRYLALFECRDCNRSLDTPRGWALHLGPICRCPICGTHRLNRLKEPDRIDRVHSDLTNLIERLMGGKLFHCRFCRIQFYDRRPLAFELPPAMMENEADAAAVSIMNPPDTAKSDE